MPRKPIVLTALVTALIAVAVVLLVLNFTSAEKKIDEKLDRSYATADPQFGRSLSALLGPPLQPGNEVEVLLNGDQIFDAMLEAIRAAQHTITFETYIYWSESIGKEFASALSERARAGVAVHVLLDWIGSAKVEQRYLDEMKAAGVEIERYHEPHWSHLARLNNRTHRKLLVVDGKVGFTGGVGIADKWLGNARNPDEWRDTHFRVRGPVVAQMQAVFLDNWVKANGRVLHGENYFPALSQAGAKAAQMFSSSPSGGSESMHLMYLMAITAAERSIHLSSSYFVPDAMTIAALVAAVKRGVEVRIITPGQHIDSDIVRRASRSLWGDLLQAGVKIAEYQPTMFHCKVLVVDDLFVSVGSTNFDNRSFRLNDEANLNVLDAAFAHQQRQIFEADWAKSREITYAQWQARPLREKAIEQASALLRTQL